MDVPDAEPIHLCYVDGDPDRRDRVADALGGRPAVSIATEARRAAVIDRLDGDDPPDCVVSAQELEDGSGIELLTAVRDRDRELPFFLAPAVGSETLAARATRAGVTEYVADSLPDEADALVDHVLEAVDRYERQQYRRENCNLFEALMRKAPFAIYFKDAEGRHVRVSDALSASTDPIGKTDLEVHGTRETYEEDLRVIETGEPIIKKEEEKVEEFEDRVERHWQQTTKLPLRDESGTVTGLIGFSYTITDLKRRERALQEKANRLDQFASFVSHDLRNPLNIAHGYLDLAIDGDETALYEVENALERMDSLIDDLLTMAHGDDGIPSVDRASLGAYVDRAWSQVAVEEATLRTEIPAGLEIQANGGQLTQLLENLFRNAIDHAGPDVTVVVGATERGFFVEDDGPGIPEDRRESIFEYGYTDSESGSGMGLAIVEQVADFHDWEVTVREGRADGARFEVSGCNTITPAERRVADVDGVSVDLSTSADVGDARPPGEARYDDETGEWIVRGGGANVWNETEEFHYVWTTVDGPARIAARVTDLETIGEYTKAGVMVRADPDAGAPLGYVGLTPVHGSEVLWRPDADAKIASRQFEDVSSPPRWYRLDRVGDRITCYTSADGSEWTVIDQRTVPLGETVVVGLAVCSFDAHRLCTASFDGVSVYSLDPSGADER